MNTKVTPIKTSDIKKINQKERLLIQDLYNLMPFKIREILLVSSLYDAFIIEEEGLISEMVIEEYRHLLLSSPPRVTRVSSGKEALSKAKNNHYDLVITMSKNIGMSPSIFGKKIKQIHPKLPVVQLATDVDDLYKLEESRKEGIDKNFFWNGDAELFLAIVKNIEDQINAPYDTANGNVQILLLLEDSIRYYSMFLPIIYTEVVNQVQHSISEDINETQRLLRRRGRPKIILTDNYEEGKKIFERYKDNILGVISDVRFIRKGKVDPDAGHDFINMVKRNKPYIPTLLQSSESKNRKRAEELGSYFIDKNSTTLIQDFKQFLLKHLGFGDFVFLKPKKEVPADKPLTLGKDAVEIASASNMKEFEELLQKVPLDSIRFHAERNDFSKWLMARGEFTLAMKLRPQKVTDFKNLHENRRYLVQVFNESRRNRHLGVMTDFSQQKFEFESSFTKLSGNLLGGKARGIAFIRSLLSRYDIQKKYKNTKIIVPSTIVIGTEIFDQFISENKLQEIQNLDLKDSEIAKKFLEGKLPDKIVDRLQTVLSYFKTPIAVRSSSLLEDSQNRPFAGMYSTYLLPNNNPNKKKRLKQLCDAIKLVFSSVFYKDAQSYIESTASKIEEEKMGILIQLLVGKKHKKRFYPTFSGVAQSYNFYPMGRQKREDGVASIAVGLGHTIVGGEKTLHFSPIYPNIIPEFSTPKQIFENTQKKLYVLDMQKDFELTKNEEGTLEKSNISDIAEDNTLNYLVSTYDKNNDIIRDEFSPEGPYLVTFANILKHDFFPLADILRDILDIGKKSMGCDVEIEFAVDIDPEGEKPPVFAILQIRPLVISHERQEINWDERQINKKDILLKSNKSRGNGIIKDIKDIIYIPPENITFSKTVDVAEETGKINEKMNQPYVLIGPGRWGTQDPFLGIPVKWRQISNAGLIVEAATKEFNIKPSQGTHFFQNIISRGVGYINTTIRRDGSYVDWKWLNNQKPYKKYQYIRHIKFDTPLEIRLDGKNGKALVLKPTE